MPEDQAPAPAAPHHPLRATAFAVAAIAGLAVSSMLLIQEFHAPVFCATNSQCDAVQHSAYSKPFGIPLAVLGTIYFFSAILTPIVPIPRRHAVQRVIGIVGIGCGALFLGIQAIALGKFCYLCVIVDSSAIVLGLTVLARPYEIALPPILTGSLAIIASLVPIAYGLSQPAPSPSEPVRETRLPAAIRDAQIPGVVTIVEFVDFECPYCRRLHQMLNPIVESYGDRVRVVRFHRPLPFHEGARPAALAACCAEEQGLGEPMVDALFQAEELDPEACEEIAADLGADLGSYRDCLASNRPDEILEEHDQAGESANISGLPTFFIGNERFVGVVDERTLRASIDRALGELEVTDAGTRD